MKLILEYQSGDDCTWSATNTLAVNYDSAEALAVDFEAAIRKARKDQLGELKFAGHEFYPGYFFYQSNGQEVYSEPFIGTFDEWFVTNEVK